MSYIAIRNLTKRFRRDVLALDDVSLEIRQGEWLAIMGPSGSGKSTLLNILGGLDTPTCGQVLVDGLDLTAAGTRALTRYRREQVGLVFQQFHLISYLTVLENVCLAQYLHSMTDPDEARQALERVGLGERLDHLPHQLSGGEQQRVCIARALINSPKILLADEPTGNLDRDNHLVIVELLQRLHREGHTIVMVTHDPELASAATRTVEIRHGRLHELPPGHPRSLDEFRDEILEQLWTLPEEGTRPTVSALSLPASANLPALLSQMSGAGLLAIDDETIALTPEGRVLAQGLVRRHRLAEIMLFQTLGMSDHLAEQTACRLEHVLSPEVTDGICTFLGHPRKCPHGMPIPIGPCCQESHTPEAGREQPMEAPQGRC